MKKSDEQYNIEFLDWWYNRFDYTGTKKDLAYLAWKEGRSYVKTEEVNKKAA